MNRSDAVLLAALLLTVPSVALAGAGDPLWDARAWLLAALPPDTPLHEQATIWSLAGEERVTGEEALERLAARIAPFVLPAVVEDAAGTGDRPYSVGRGMLVEIGAWYECGPFRYVHAPFVGVDGYHHLAYGATASPFPIDREGWILDADTGGATGGRYREGYAHFAGATDLYCINFGFSIYLVAPKVAGYIEHVPEGALPGPLPDLPHPLDVISGP